MIKYEKDMFKLLKKEFPFITFINIETGHTETGVADVYYFSQIYKITGWIELKIAKEKSDGSIEIEYRPRQRLFLQNHFKCNRNTFTLIYYKNYFYLTDCFIDKFKNEKRLFELSIYKSIKLKTTRFIKLILGVING